MRCSLGVRPPGWRSGRTSRSPMSRPRLGEFVLERGGLRMTTPAPTALDLCDTVGGDAIDTVLRTRAASLAELHAVLGRTSRRRGNQLRRQLLLDSRDEPWSEAERRAHQLLRDAGLTGWR